MIPQGTPEWAEARLGRVTASRVADVIAKTKSGWGASRANYMAALIAERLTGVPMESYTNSAMQWGTDTEPEARAAYAFYTDAEVSEAGFYLHPKIAMSGASPDGLVGVDGLLEIKCPNAATHIDTLLGHSVPGKYVTQIAWQMACTDRVWCDFVSFDPRMPESARLFVRRVNRDDKLIADLERDVIEFLAELAEKTERVRRYGEPLTDTFAASLAEPVKFADGRMTMTSAAKVEITEANLEALWIAFRLGVQEFVSNAPNDIVFQSENAYRKAAEKAGIAAIVETLVGAAERLP